MAFDSMFLDWVPQKTSKLLVRSGKRDTEKKKGREGWRAPQSHQAACHTDFRGNKISSAVL